eukprot:g18758.t1
MPPAAKSPFLLRSGEELRSHFRDCDAPASLVARIFLLRSPGVSDVDFEQPQQDVAGTALHKALTDYFAAGKLQALSSDMKKKNPRAFISRVLSAAATFLDDSSGCFFVTNDGYSEFEVEPAYVSRSVQWCYGMLANAFLANINPAVVIQGLSSFPGMFEAVSPPWVSGLDPFFLATVAKIQCLIHYLNTEVDAKRPDIVWQKVFVRDLPEAVREALRKGLSISDVAKGSGAAADEDVRDSAESDPFCKMEAPEQARGFVNFGNQMFGYGRFTASCTQEEIMQMCCPEFNVGLLFYRAMEDECVVLTHNVRRFVKGEQYEGYLNSFRLKLESLVEHLPIFSSDQTIITMDAVMFDHFSEKHCARDVGKAFLGWWFTAQWWEITTIEISTGKWGCGEFGGDPFHKFAQQLYAAVLVERALREIYQSVETKIMDQAGRRLFFLRLRGAAALCGLGATTTLAVAIRMGTKTKTRTKTPTREDGEVSSASCCDGVDDEKVTERAHAEDEAFTVYQVVGRDSTGGSIYERFIVQPGDPGYNGVLYDGYLLPSKNPDGIPAQKLARIAADQAQAQGGTAQGVINNSIKAAYKPVTLPPSSCGNGYGKCSISWAFFTPQDPHMTEEKFVERLSNGLGEQHKGARDLPAAWHAWRNENPGYTFNFFNSATGKQYLKEHFDPRILRAWNAIKNGAYKKDLFQLCVLYRDGGFFIDSKNGPAAGVEVQVERNALSAEERAKTATHLTGNLDKILEKIAAIPSNYASTKKLMYASKQAKLAHENIETVGFSAACQHLGKMDQVLLLNSWTYAKPRNPTVGEIIHNILMSVERHDEHREHKLAVTGPAAYFRALTGSLPAFPKKHKKRFEEAERIHTLQGKLSGTKALCHEMDGGVGQVKTLLWSNEDLASEMWFALPDSSAVKKDGSLQPLNEKGETVALVAGGSCAPGTSSGGCSPDGPETSGGTVVVDANSKKELAIVRKLVFTDPGEGWKALGGDAYTKKLEEKPCCLSDDKFMVLPIFEDRCYLKRELQGEPGPHWEIINDGKTCIED